MSNFPDNLGLIGVGDGKVVLPAPPIESGWNPFVRGADDGTFKWKLVTGLEPDPSLGYQFVEAYSYRLEITPDLGWTNKEAMFEPYLDPTVGNARLHVFQNLREGIDLVVNADETVTYTIDAATMKTILAPGFEDYLWRVVAVAETGHEGHSSEIQYFRGNIWLPNLAWTLDDLPEHASNMTILLTGNRSSRVTKIEVNGKDVWTAFPTPETWEAEVPLAGGRNVFFVRAYDAQGNGTEYRQIETEAQAKTIREEEYWNRFDDFGYVLGLERLPRERNKPYKLRIKDIYTHRASARYSGLMNAVTRELDLPYYDQALLIRPAVNSETGKRWTDITVWLSSKDFCVMRERILVEDEYHIVEGRTWQVRTDENLEDELTIQTRFGKTVPAEAFKVQRDRNGPYIQFLDSKYAGKPVYLRYRYYTSISVAGKTVQELATAIAAVTYKGKQLLEVTVDSDVATERAEGIQAFAVTQVGIRDYLDAGGVKTEQLPVRWAQAELRAFVDDEFIATHWNDRGTLWGTEYDGWAFQLKNKLKTTWGYLVAGQGVWSDPMIRTSGLGRIPHHYDAPKGAWYTTRGDAPYRLEAAVANVRDFLDPRDRSALYWRGVPWDWLQSGFAWGFALYTLVDSSPFTVVSKAEEFYTVRQVVQPGEGASFDDLGIDTVETS